MWHYVNDYTNGNAPDLEGKGARREQVLRRWGSPRLWDYSLGAIANAGYHVAARMSTSRCNKAD